MRYTTTFLFALILLAGCATAPPQKCSCDSITSIPKTVQTFEELYDTEVSSDIAWATPEQIVNRTGNDWLGYCEPYKGNIYISTKLKYNPAGYEAILFHELGHCEFGLRHDNEVIQVDELELIPKSIMFMNGKALIKYYLVHRKHYREELGKRIRKAQNRRESD